MGAMAAAQLHALVPCAAVKFSTLQVLFMGDNVGNRMSLSQEPGTPVASTGSRAPRAVSMSVALGSAQLQASALQPLDVPGDGVLSLTGPYFLPERGGLQCTLPAPVGTQGHQCWRGRPLCRLKTRTCTPHQNSEGCWSDTGELSYGS